MNRFNLLGLIICGGAAVMVIFESIGAMMTAGEIVFQFSTLVDLFGNDAFTWIDNIPVAFAQNALDWLVTVPVFFLLLGLGVFCFLVGGLTSR